MYLFLTCFNSISFYSLILWVLYFVLKLKYFAPTLQLRVAASNSGRHKFILKAICLVVSSPFR